MVNLIHEKLLEILKNIDYICREENISYMLNAGTLLGAVREKGFIEWDEDADLMMHRNDFEILIKCCDKYFAQKGLFLGWDGRVPFIALQENPEIMVEILIFDTVPQGKFKQKYQLFSLKIIQGMFKENIDYGAYSVSNRILIFITASIGRCLRQKTKLELYKRFSTLANNEHSDYVFLSNERFRFINLKIKRSIIAETIKMPFADTEFMVPTGWDSFLRLYYGDDYMIPKRENYYVC